MIKFSCPECQKELKVNSELAGRTGKCPGCGSKIRVPEKKKVANEVLEDWLNEPVLPSVVETPTELPSSMENMWPDRQTLPDIVFPQSVLIAYGMVVAGVCLLVVGGVLPFVLPPELIAFSILSFGMAPILLVFGIYFILNFGPLLSITSDGLQYYAAKKMIAWHDIERAYYWNPMDEASFVSKLVASQLTGNGEGEVFIRLRFTPQGREKHKRVRGFAIVAPNFVDDDMLISMEGIPFRELAVIDLAAEINKRVLAVRKSRRVG